MDSYISKEKLMAYPIRRDHYDTEHGNPHFINGIESVLEYAEDLPAEDVEPVRHGRWIKRDVGALKYPYRCSVCRRVEAVKEPYCNCGAKMDLQEENK